MRALLVAGSPEPSSLALVTSLAAEADYVAAVDRGADVCHAAGIVPDAFCGDADTVSPEAMVWLRTAVPASGDGDRETAPGLLSVTPADEVREVPEIHGLEGVRGIRLFPPAKYDTDLSLAFSCLRQVAAEEGVRLEVTVTCASAGRMDHALAVFGVLASNADLAPRLVEDGSECRVLAPSGRSAWAFGEGDVGRRFSFVALADGTVVSERGMRWELDRYHVDALRDRGISNVVDEPDAVVTCHDGVLAAFLMR